MGNEIFGHDGHIKNWVFFPPAWGGEDYWAVGFNDTEKQSIFDHMKGCLKCREMEIEATLRWAELRPRATRCELISVDPSKLDATDSGEALLFDKYPICLLDHVILFIKGKSITFERESDGRVKKITGLINGNIESECLFIYDEGTTSIHCYCHNTEDNPITESDRMTFADFQIDHSRKHQVFYTLDVTEFKPECKEIKRYHTAHKLFTDTYGKVVRILEDNKPWYSAEYDEQRNLVRKTEGPVTTEYGYSDGIKKFRKSFSKEGPLEHLLYEYAENSHGPVRILKNTDAGIWIESLNSYAESADEQSCLTFEPDGITRYYYDSMGFLSVKVRLPRDTVENEPESILTDIKNVPDKFDSVELVVVDNATSNIRIINKLEGSRYIDQTAFLENGLVCRVFNHPEAVNNTLLSSHFSRRHWIDIVENEDSIL